ncbi:MAG: hypothetical protein WB608_02215, partial [Terracidiphilus sp.]
YPFVRIGTVKPAPSSGNAILRGLSPPAVTDYDACSQAKVLFSAASFHYPTGGGSHQPLRQL